MPVGISSYMNSGSSRGEGVYDGTKSGFISRRKGVRKRGGERSKSQAKNRWKEAKSRAPKPPKIDKLGLNIHIVAGEVPKGHQSERRNLWAGMQVQKRLRAGA